MIVEEIKVKNFRLFKGDKGTVTLDDDITIVVGKNNSGKTSLSRIVKLFLVEKGKHLTFDDFNIDVRRESKANEEEQNFIKAFYKYQDYLNAAGETGVDEEDLQEYLDVFQDAVPKIELELKIKYSDSDSFTAVQPFLMDLDPTRSNIIISFSYEAPNAAQMYQDLYEYSDKEDPLKFIEANYRDYYQVVVRNHDPNDHEVYRICRQIFRP